MEFHYIFLYSQIVSRPKCSFNISGVIFLIYLFIRLATRDAPERNVKFEAQCNHELPTLPSASITHELYIPPSKPSVHEPTIRCSFVLLNARSILSSTGFTTTGSCFVCLSHSQVPTGVFLYFYQSKYVLIFTEM